MLKLIHEDIQKYFDLEIIDGKATRYSQGGNFKRSHLEELQGGNLMKKISRILSCYCSKIRNRG